MYRWGEDRLSEDLWGRFCYPFPLQKAELSQKLHKRLYLWLQVYDNYSSFARKRNIIFICFLDTECLKADRGTVPKILCNSVHADMSFDAYSNFLLHNAVRTFPLTKVTVTVKLCSLIKGTSGKSI